MLRKIEDIVHSVNTNLFKYKLFPVNLSRQSQVLKAILL